MKLEKLLHELKRYLKKGNKESQTKYDQIDELLRQLKGKKHHLKRRLEKEKRGCKRKRLKAELAIVDFQLKKGRKRRDKLVLLYGGK
ncbi:MAG: hypothetical protein LC541_16085 [Candidatus Thiodiazotropha sp.]|nr:hypothetical protein [Candidatus Thiodiazotropha sp.]MCU7802038.1 hypothetical protein [Candidatus Thiodiazotropha sp. (ex Lucinoma borealis)]MCU7838390.1 hypothetical protein [Candidatus Thiodiazotropha sp. (ex Troendleina suluensis)]MCU7885298.1 hypothetical protein [Candidatus Thiodiazotropha sp. (ex Lucinoma annulata)]MCM8884793.1 hypothetical protein [Candidatus Thiodiazotropha sp.]